MMRGFSAERVFGLEDRIYDQLAGMLVLQPVQHPGAVLPGRNHPGEAHFGQMLGHSGRRLPDGLSQGAYGHLTVPQGKDDPHPGRVSEHGEHFHSQLHILAISPQGASIICIHTHMMTYANNPCAR